MKLDVLCNNHEHPVVPWLVEWREAMEVIGHDAKLCHSIDELEGGDFLFLVSCSLMISIEVRRKYAHTLVLHASALPEGRGWSPYIWDVLSGKNEINLCLLEASEPVDSGDIWLRREIPLDGHELLEEIHKKLFEAELDLMSIAVEQMAQIVPEKQPVVGDSYYRKRTPVDSKLDVSKNLAEQFDLLRVVDNERYPAFFEFRGKRYSIKIEKLEDD